eukprot:259113_1
MNDITQQSNTGCVSHDDTYIDVIYKHLSKIHIEEKCIDKLKYIIYIEEYDTESIAQDLENENNEDQYEGNVSHYVINSKCIDSISALIQSAQRSVSSVNVGLRFYYWIHYKKLKKIPDREQLQYNLNDHSGYQIRELYIDKKYSTFKEEIANYEYIEWKEFNHLVLIKARFYLHSNTVKQMTAAKASSSNCKLHYRVPTRASIGEENLIAVILYTDFSALSTDFSSTFRKLTPWETLASIKNRNRQYWWMSKRLRETVERFGQRGLRGKVSNNPGLVGPFYTGMSCVMTLPEFNIRLCTPTSTSSHIEIAIVFSGEEGMIMQLNNNTHSSELLRGFDCSWISRYKDEAEKLFFGGFFRIKIESIIIRETKRNLEDVITPLFYLDAMITGTHDIHKMNIKPSNNDVSILSSLWGWKLNHKLDKQTNKYICDTFDCFCDNKKT